MKKEISDETIKIKESNKKKDFCIFQIILIKTNEVIGFITYNFKYNSGFTYSGNISYDIKPEFQNMGYAKRALALLKTYIINNVDKKETLYASITPENEASRKMILESDGELVYKGDVPKDDITYLEDGVKEVEVYKIKM